MPDSEFEFLEGDGDGQFVLVGGPIVQLRGLLARGEINEAVRLYEETGAVARAELLVDAQTGSFELRKGIALLFKGAHDFAAAAHTLQLLKLEAEAAAAFEQAGEFSEAARAWGKAGELLKAAAAFERAGNTEAALGLYRQAGATERAAECLARGRRFKEAAQGFQAVGNALAEFEALKAGLASAPDDLDVVARLAELMLKHGRKEHAARLCAETARRVPPAKDHVGFLTQLAAGLEAIGNEAAAFIVRQRLGPRSPAPAAPAARAEAGADAYGFLKALPMFAGLSFEDMTALYRVCSMQAWQAGEQLIDVGQPGRGLFLIVEGQVEVFAGAGPTARLLNTLGVGGYVGEISLVLDGPTTARVTARVPVKALFISREAFHQYLFSAPTAALRIYQLFTHNLAERVRVLSAGR